NEHDVKKKESKSGFWMTVLKVEIADLAFAVDSILAAVALAVTLPATGLFEIGSLDGAQFIVIFAGGMIGVIIMSFAANLFVEFFHIPTGLELSAFGFVVLFDVKLDLLTISHPDVTIISETFVHSTTWKLIFYIGLVSIALAGWFLSNKVEKDQTN